MAVRAPKLKVGDHTSNIIHPDEEETLEYTRGQLHEVEGIQTALGIIYHVYDESNFPDFVNELILSYRKKMNSSDYMDATSLGDTIKANIECVFGRKEVFYKVLIGDEKYFMDWIDCWEMFSVRTFWRPEF